MEDGDRHSASIVIRDFPVLERGRGQEQVMEWDLARVRPSLTRAREDGRGCHGVVDSETAPAWTRRHPGTVDPLPTMPRPYTNFRELRHGRGARGSEEDPDLADEILNWLRSSGTS